MGNCTPSITISAAVRRLHPGLGNALVGAGLVLQANAEIELVTADQFTPGRHGAIVVGYSDVPVLVTASAAEPASIAFATDDTVFAAALIAALVRGTAPAVADPSTRALMDMAARVAVRDVNVLIGGPTGTGKEVLARHIHVRTAINDVLRRKAGTAGVDEVYFTSLVVQ